MDFNESQLSHSLCRQPKVQFRARLEVEGHVPILIIQDVSSELISALDAKASSLGITRTDFLRRTLIREALVGINSADESNLTLILELLPDATNEVIMGGAWE